jgi:acyl-CoA thioesterase FadM
LKHAAYLLNPFEMEAYGHMYDQEYLKRCEGGAQEWRKYAKMSLKERLKRVKR